jgi:hypothetical protein
VQRICKGDTILRGRGAVENNKWYQSKLGAVFKVKRDFKLQQQELLQI